MIRGWPLFMDEKLLKRCHPRKKRRKKARKCGKKLNNLSLLRKQFITL